MAHYELHSLFELIKLLPCTEVDFSFSISSHFCCVTILLIQLQPCPRSTAVIGKEQSSFMMFNTPIIILITRKACYRKETTRCTSTSCSLQFKVRQHSLSVAKIRKPGFRAWDRQKDTRNSST